MGGEGEKKVNDGERRREGREKEMGEIYYTQLSEHRECKCNCVQLFQVGSHLQHSVSMCAFREQNSPGSVDGCGCGSVEDGEF